MLEYCTSCFCWYFLGMPFYIIWVIITSRMPAVCNNISETCFCLLLSDILYIFNAASYSPQIKHQKEIQ